MAAPTATWAIDATGLILTATWDQGVTAGGTENNAVLIVGGVSVTATYTTTATPLTTWAIPSAVANGASVTVSLATDTVRTSDINATPNAAISGASVTNGSLVYGGYSGTAGGLMNGRCTIRSVTFSQSTSSAGMKKTWGDYRTSVPCAIQALRSAELTQQQKETGRRYFRGFFPPDLTIANEYRVKAITGPVGLSGVVLQCTGSGYDEAGRGAFQVVPLEEIEGVVA